MSDYIRKSAVIKIIEKAIENSSDFLQHDTQIDIMFEVQELPTVDETEIIRKAFERVVEKIDDLETHFDNGDFATCRYSLVVLKDVLRIVKEECGINE